MNKIILKEEYAILRISSEKYGDFDFILDLDDIERIKKYKWAVHKTGGINGRKIYYYAMTNNKTLGSRMLHRVVMNAPKKLKVDHIDGNTLNTRKYNLRVCDNKTNCQNRKRNRNNTSGHTGVTWDKRTGKWVAFIHIGDKRKSLGYYSDLDMAVLARENAERDQFDDYTIELRKQKNNRQI